MRYALRHVVLAILLVVLNVSIADAQRARRGRRDFVLRSYARPVDRPGPTIPMVSDAPRSTTAIFLVNILSTVVYLAGAYPGIPPVVFVPVPVSATSR